MFIFIFSFSWVSLCVGLHSTDISIYIFSSSWVSLCVGWQFTNISSLYISYIHSFTGSWVYHVYVCTYFQFLHGFSGVGWHCYLYISYFYCFLRISRIFLYIFSVFPGFLCVWDGILRIFLLATFDAHGHDEPATQTRYSGSHEKRLVFACQRHTVAQWCQHPAHVVNPDQSLSGSQ